MSNKKEEVGELAISLSFESQSADKQISSLNKLINRTEKEFKSAAKGVKNFEDTYQGLDSKIQKLTKQLDANNKKLEIQEKEHKSVAKALEVSKKKLEEMDGSVDKNSKEWKEQADLVQKNADKLAKLSSDITITKGNISKLTTELNDSKTKFEQLGNKTETLDEKLENISREAELTQSEFNKLGTELNQNGTYFIAMKNDKNQYVFVVADKNGNPAVTSNGKVQLMDLTGAKVSNGTNIWTWEYIKGSNTQMWNLINTKSANEARAKGLTLVKDFVEGEYNILSATNNNFALDVSGGKQSNGTNVGIWERNYADAEKFRIEKASENGEYYIRTAASGYKSSLDVSCASPNRGANVHQWTSNNSNAQIWKLYKYADGSYVFINSVNGKALDIAGGNVRKGQNVGVWDVNGILNAQHWKIESATTFDAANPELEKITDISSLGISEKDWVQLGSIADSSFRLDISSGTDANGQNVHIWNSNGTNAQKFRIKKLTNGTLSSAGFQGLL